MSLHVAEVVAQAAPMTSKAAVASAVTTAIVPSVWTLPDVATVIGIACTIAMTTAAITFQWLNYRINKRKAGQ